jgi:hypothetical protein
VMAEGQIIAEGTPSDISNNTEVIDAYLGSHHDADLFADEQVQSETLEAADQSAAAATDEAEINE